MYTKKGGKRPSSWERVYIPDQWPTLLYKLLIMIPYSRKLFEGENLHGSVESEKTFTGDSQTTKFSPSKVFPLYSNCYTHIWWAVSCRWPFSHFHSFLQAEVICQLEESAVLCRDREKDLPSCKKNATGNFRCNVNQVLSQTLNDSLLSVGLRMEAHPPSLELCPSISPWKSVYKTLVNYNYYYTINMYSL